MLYYGDNLPILRNRDYFPSESIDLIYLDSPFKSDQDYNVLFSEANGSASAAQVAAFRDTWRWDATARHAFDEMIETGGRPAEALAALRGLVGESDMLAYLSMMAPRLVELRRVLRKSGSLYLHCNSFADSYLRVLLDSVFDNGLRCEVIWDKGFRGTERKRNWQQSHDVLLFYTKTDEYTWNDIFQEYADPTMSRYNQTDEEGNSFALIKRRRSKDGSV